MNIKEKNNIVLKYDLPTRMYRIYNGRAIVEMFYNYDKALHFFNNYIENKGNWDEFIQNQKRQRNLLQRSN